MTKTWILRTDTKGTGAHMVPLEDTLVKPAARRERGAVLPRRKRRPDEIESPEPRAPDRFKIVDIMTQQVLAEDVGTSEAVDLLRGIRSNIDVRIYVWNDRAEKWRLLSLPQQRALWALRNAA